MSAIAAVALGAACQRSSESPADAAPEAYVPPERIVLIVIDTLRRDHVSAYGGRIPTPTLDALAERGQLMKNAFSSYHQTTMSMAALFTGRTPSIDRGRDREAVPWTGETWCGLRRLAQRPPKTGCIPESVPTLAEKLSEVGYETAAIVTNRLLHEPGGYARGFEHWHEIPYERPTWDVANEAVARFLEQRRTDRFFLYVHSMDVHDFQRRDQDYASGVPMVDTAVERLLALLADAGVRYGTPIIVTSDQGERPGERHFIRGREFHPGVIRASSRSCRSR